MVERLKTILLFILFITSIVLAKFLWIELPQRNSSLQTPDPVISYSLIDMMAPSKYLIHFDENNSTLFYDESKYTLWADARTSIKSALESEKIKIEEVKPADMGSYNRKRSISFEFPEKLNTYILAKALEIEKPNQIIDAIDSVDSIYIYLGSEEPFFLFSKNNKIIKLSNNEFYHSQAQGQTQNWDVITRVEKFIGPSGGQVEEDPFSLANLKEKIWEIESSGKFNYYYSMKEMMGTKKDLYIPYEMDNILPSVFVENQIRTLDQEATNQLVESFFKEKIDYIREVVEANGSKIYIQDQKVLKLNENGVLEYFNALEEPVEKRNFYESLTTASDFLSRVVGNSKGVYLADTELIKDEFNNQGYAFSFKYRVRGIPVILESARLNEFVKMEVYNKHVISYKQLMRKDMAKSLDLPSLEKEVQALSSFDIIDSNYDIFLEDYLKTQGREVGEPVKVEEVLSSIEDITLAYYDPTMKEVDQELTRVWAIRTKDFLYSFDIYSGRKIDKRKV